ncbi:11657_t:CDS:2 [Ambispora gerdemannii]|uniref:11657_t:CDS:1 n=1 Tax=Ambispora gerdemannii TaxID=144530 RepID=A0A9N8W1S2_9GLOM|nr:11657_t:CDS:2 [Ambispora gerdemannii]
MTPKQYSKGLSYVKHKPQKQQKEEEEIELINSRDEEKPQIVVLREGKHLSEEQVKDYLEQKSSTKKDNDLIDGKNIVLASSSPNRRKILSTILGNNYSVIPSTFPETLDKRQYTPEEYVIANAIEKGKEVYARLMTPSSSYRPDLIISADTVVYKDQILEKPESSEHAFEILKLLNGNIHDVTFRHTSDEFFRAYIETGEPMNKAGKLSVVVCVYLGITERY